MTTNSPVKGDGVMPSIALIGGNDTETTINHTHRRLSSGSVVPLLPLTKTASKPSIDILMIVTKFDNDGIDQTEKNQKSGDNNDNKSSPSLDPATLSTDKLKTINKRYKKKKKMTNNGNNSSDGNNSNHNRHGHHSPSHHHYYKKAIDKLQKVKKEAKYIELKKQQRRLIKTPRPLPVKENLRKKFIAQAMSYIGTPYSKRYYQQASGEPKYSGPYLDCCGLIRQVLKDLQQDFGFIPGDWNQAYQFDTLPIRVESVHHLQPGDLIFYSGNYVSKRSKKQRYNMTHVEIFLGGSTGEETLAARSLRGVVSIFPSYKFESSLWTVEKYYFCSIDTWLNGVCLSRNPFPSPPKKAAASNPTRSPLTTMRF